MIDLPPWNDSLDGEYEFYNVGNVGILGIHDKKRWWKNHGLIPFSSQDFSELIERFPLTPGYVDSFYSEHITELFFGYGNLIYPADPLFFRVFIAKDRPKVDTLRAFVHEAVHGIYRVYSVPFGKGTRSDNEKEQKINEMADKFVHRNPEFLEELIRKLNWVSI